MKIIGKLILGYNCTQIYRVQIMSMVNIGMHYQFDDVVDVYSS